MASILAIDWRTASKNATSSRIAVASGESVTRENRRLSRPVWAMNRFLADGPKSSQRRIRPACVVAGLGQSALGLQQVVDGRREGVQERLSVAATQS